MRMSTQEGHGSLLETSINRRGFVEMLVAAPVIGKNMATILLVPQVTTNPTEPQLKTVDLSGDQLLVAIKSYEARMGKRSLDNYDAQFGSTLYAELFTATTGSSISPSALSGKTFFLRHGFTNKEDRERYAKAEVLYDEELNSHPVITAFGEDYPEKRRTLWNTDKRMMLMNLAKGNVAWNDFWLKDMYLSMIAINSPQDDKYAFGKVDYRVSCDANTPLAQFRSELMKLYVKYDGSQTLVRGAYDFHKGYAYMLNTTRPYDKTIPVSNVYKYQFALYSYKNIVDSTGVHPDHVENSLDSFVSEYIAAQILTQAGKIYVSDVKPSDFANFQAMLIQSNISFDQLVGYYRTSNLENFLIHLIDGTKQKFANVGEVFEFGIEKLVLRKPSGQLFDWKDLQRFFPKVRPDDYQYLRTSLMNKAGNHDNSIAWGCNT